MAVYIDKSDTAWLEASVDGRLDGGCAGGGLCVAIAAVAVAAGDDGTELLSDSIAVSTVERI